MEQFDVKCPKCGTVNKDLYLYERRVGTYANAVIVNSKSIGSKDLCEFPS